MKNADQIDAALSKVLSLVNQLSPDNVAPSALDLEALYNDGIDALEQDRFKEALEIFGLLAARMPGNSSYQFGFALCLQHFGETQLAGEYYSLAYALDPSDAACAYRLGECLLASGHIPDAQDALRAAIQLTALPGSDPGIRLLAEQLLESLN
jgi:tetratricopeptide (TPR) repeat protein